MLKAYKPKALVFCSPFEGQRGYFLAGLSHYYQIDVYYPTSRRFRFKWQIFYPWAYSQDARFFKYQRLREFLDAPAGYDAVFIHPNALTPFFGWYENQQELTEFVLKMKQKGKKIYWLDMGENQYHQVCNPKFWENIDFCLKGQVFKKQYEYINFDPKKVALYQGKDVMENPVTIADNMGFDLEKYRHKILPCPFTPSIIKAEDLNFSGVNKIYDISANTRTWGNGALRYAIYQEIAKRIQNKFVYSFDYDEKGWAGNYEQKDKLSVNYLLKMGKLGKLLFKVKYNKYFYPGPLYLHNLSHSKCYLGLASIYLSFRTADCWGAGVVLLNFSMDKCDYGIPMEDGVNYVSVGERDEMTDDNEHIKPGCIPQILEKVELILGDEKKQKEIVKNGYATFEEYFSSPKQYVKKIFIDKIEV